MAFGLPIAVTIGWTLATPARRPTPAGLPGGAGGIGAAPERVGTAEPVTAVRYSSRPVRPPAASPAISTPAPPPSASGPPAATSPAPAPSPSSSSTPLLPPLTLPPVPTPTEEVTSMPGPSAPPSTDPSANPSTP